MVERTGPTAAEQGRSIPAQLSRAPGPIFTPGQEFVAVAQKLAPSVRWDVGDRSDYTSPGRRPHSIHGNGTFPASARHLSKTRREPFAVSLITAQSRWSSTSLPPLRPRWRVF